MSQDNIVSKPSKNNKEMSFLLSDGIGNWVVQCEFAHRKILQDYGAHFEDRGLYWKVPATVESYKYLVDNLPNLKIDSDVPKVLENIKQTEEKIKAIKKLSESNDKVNLRIPGFLGTLHNYQKIGVMFASTASNGVLISDDMGLGKSAQSIGTACFRKHRGEIKKCLVVTPASLKYNWPLEIKKFTNEKFIVIDGPAEKRVAQWLTPDVFFTVVNYELVVEDLFGGEVPSGKKKDKEKKEETESQRKKKIRTKMLKSIRDGVFDMIICDEIHWIKSHKSKRSQCIKALRSKYRIGLSGTPLDGRLEELHSIMEFLVPGLFQKYMVFLQRHAQFDYFGNVVKYKNVDEIREKIQPFFIRRLKTDVLKELPEKTYKDVLIDLTAEEKKEYNELKKGKHIITQDSEAMEIVIRCKQFCNYPKLINPNVQHNSKLNVFMEIIDEIVSKNGNKAIIFSQYSTMTAILKGELEDKGLKLLYLTGETPKDIRANMQQQFNTDPKIDIILGTDAMATGLNLTGASYVINYDDFWSPSVMNQRAGRCIAENGLVFCPYSSSMAGPGLIEIQNVEIGDKIITHTGKVGNVVYKKSREHRGMVTSIDYYGWYEPLVCTYDHKVFIKRGEELMWVAAHTVLPSDSMAFPRQKDTIRLEYVLIKDGWRLLPTKSDICTIDGCNIRVEARNMCKVHYRKWLEENRGIVGPGKNPVRGDSKQVKLPNEIKIDDDWIRLFGWYVAEGFASVKNGKGKFISLSGHSKEEYILKSFGKLFDGIGVKWNIYKSKRRKCVELRAYSSELAMWFMSWFGYRAANKSLPNEIMNIPPDQAAIFLRGYTDGDGYQRGKQVEWVSASRTLCHQMCQMAIRAGFIPSMRSIIHPKTKNNHFIGGYTKFGSPDNKRLSDQDSNYIYRPVKRVETRNDKIRVYDLTIDSEDHSFTVGLSSVHNCHRMGQKNAVTVVNFICRGTIEENIRGILRNKEAVSGEALGDGVKEVEALKGLSSKEILELL